MNGPAYTISQPALAAFLWRLMAPALFLRNSISPSSSSTRTAVSACPLQLCPSSCLFLSKWPGLASAGSGQEAVGAYWSGPASAEPTSSYSSLERGQEERTCCFCLLHISPVHPLLLPLLLPESSPATSFAQTMWEPLNHLC